MGGCFFKPEKKSEGGEEWWDQMLVVGISKSQFQFHYVIGRGGFGKVWKVEKKKERRLLAMKEMLKARVLLKHSVSSVLNELKLLKQLNHPYLSSLIVASLSTCNTPSRTRTTSTWRWT
jgi:serine/threonine protein kinase